MRHSCQKVFPWNNAVFQDEVPRIFPKVEIQGMPFSGMGRIGLKIRRIE